MLEMVLDGLKTPLSLNTPPHFQSGPGLIFTSNYLLTS